ncbi:MAG: hypothetical protein LVS60_09660 [Nodosilinea sp. LVE1205-7]
MDYHATTPVDPRVAQAVLQAMTTDFGNASSLDHTPSSACTSGIEAPFQVLRAMGLPSPILDSDLQPTATLLHQAVQAIHSLSTRVL